MGGIVASQYHIRLITHPITPSTDPIHTGWSPIDPGTSGIGA